VISFHSLEDRVVKQFIAAASRPEAAYARLPLRESEMPQPVLLALSRVKPTDIEIKENARSRSAVLRVAERTATPLGAAGAQAYSPAPVASARRGRKGHTDGSTLLLCCDCFDAFGDLVSDRTLSSQTVVCRA